MVHIKILALDQATKTTGYSIFDNKELIEYGVLEADKKEKNPIERMKQMCDKINNIIVKHHPDFIVFENVQFQNNYGTFQSLSQLQGIIMALLFEKDIGFCIIEPTAWKSVAGVKGRNRAEQKTSAIQIVKSRYNLDVSEDEADAILIGYWATKTLLK